MTIPGSRYRISKNTSKNLLISLVIFYLLIDYLSTLVVFKLEHQCRKYNYINTLVRKSKSKRGTDIMDIV
jgi:hypothetical protein